MKFTCISNVLTRTAALTAILLIYAGGQDARAACYDETPVGWASVNDLGDNGTTGGEGGAEVTVTTFEDLETWANSEGPLIIYVSGTITQPGSDPIRIEEANANNDNPGNISILGLGTDACFQGEIRIRKYAHNIIIRNIKFDGQNSTGDGVSMDGGSGQVHHVWVDHCEFTGYTDGAIDCTHGNDYITYSWNHLYGNARSSLLGHSDSNASEDTGHLKVTYHHNWFDHEIQRQPRVRFSYLAHVYNNYYDLDETAIYAVAAAIESHVLLENNYFKDTTNPFYSSSGYPGDEEDPGYLVARNNYFENCGDTRETNGTVPEASDHYAYTLDTATELPTLLTSCTGVGVISVVEDDEAPTPNPMTWSVEPAATGPASITMTATTAADAITGVDYYFANLTDSTHDSGWLTEPEWTDTGLTPSTAYTYTVSARDRSVPPNATAASEERSATTGAPDTTAPTPNPMTWSVEPAATGTTTVGMTASTASDDSGVEYYFANLTDSSHDSGWLTDPAWTDTGLTADTDYVYQARARDLSSNLNETAPTPSATARTEAIPPIADPVAHWTLDESSGTTASDEGDSSLDGTLVNMENADWIAGYFGNALSFDGADEYVSIPHADAIDFGTGSFSITMWIRHEATGSSSAEEALLVKGAISHSTGSGKRYVLFSKEGAMRFEIDDDSDKSGVSASSDAFHTGGWVFLTAVRDTDAGLLRLYADGVQMNTATDVTGSISQSEGMYIARYALTDENAAQMTGDVDDLRIYNYALTADQVEAQMDDDTAYYKNAAETWALYER